jgi:hypothetical protein
MPRLFARVVQQALKTPSNEAAVVLSIMCTANTLLPAHFAHLITFSSVMRGMYLPESQSSPTYAPSRKIDVVTPEICIFLTVICEHDLRLVCLDIVKIKCES